MRKNERLEWISKTEALFEKWARAFAAEIKRTLKKRISHSLSQQRIRAFWSVLLSGNQMRHYSKEGEKGLSTE